MDELPKLLKGFSDKTKGKVKRVDGRVVTSSLLDELAKIDGLMAKDDFIDFCDQHDSIVSGAFEESKDFISSLITLTNWYDDMCSGGAIGLAVKVTTDDLVKIGVRRELKIDSVTTTFMPVLEYVESMLKYFDEKPVHDYGNLNSKNIITGNVIGDGNIVIPLYVHKHHWNVAKILMKPMLGLGLSHNPFSYIKNYDSLVFSVYSEMLRMTLVDKEFKLNDKWTQTLSIFSRSTAQMCFDNGYHRGIVKHISRYTSDPKARVNKLIYDYSNIIGQSVSTGYLFPNNEHHLLTRYYLEEIITSVLSPTKYNKKFVLNLQSNSETISAEISEAIMLIEKTVQRQLQLCVSLILSVKLFRDFYSHFGSYSGYIKRLDSRYSMLDTTDLQTLSSLIAKHRSDRSVNNVSVQMIYDLMGSTDSMTSDVTAWIVQGSIRPRDKYRLLAINDKTYYDPITASSILPQVDIVNMFKSLK